jgi:hypothetical protein
MKQVDQQETVHSGTCFRHAQTALHHGSSQLLGHCEGTRGIIALFFGLQPQTCLIFANSPGAVRPMIGKKDKKGIKGLKKPHMSG